MDITVNELNCCIDLCCFDEYELCIENDLIIITNDQVTKYLKYFPNYRNFAQLHKDDGPAIETTKKEYIHKYFYYLKGNPFDIKEFAEKTKHLICKNCKEFCKQNCF